MRKGDRPTPNLNGEASPFKSEAEPNLSGKASPFNLHPSLKNIKISPEDRLGTAKRKKEQDDHERGQSSSF